MMLLNANLMLSNFMMNFGDGFGWVSSIAKKVESELSAPITALVTVAVIICLAGMMFSKNQKTVEEFKSWFKRIVICYILFICSSKLIAGVKGIGDAGNGASNGASNN